jgi:DNA-binding SARP family transcriptional activator
MSTLHISLFGTVSAYHAGQPEQCKLTHVLQGLLAYLVLHRERCHARDVLAGVFWGDHDERSARSCLSTALWRLRLSLEPEGVPRGTYLLTDVRQEVGFNTNSDYRLDVAMLERCAKRIMAQPIQDLDHSSAQQLEQAVELYAADLLEGFYDEWAIRERERIRLLYTASLAYLMKYHGHRRSLDKSLHYGQQLLRYDPLREDIHREIMRLYLEMGHRELAIRQFQACRELLNKELGIQPMEETQAIYAAASQANHGAPPVLSGVLPATPSLPAPVTPIATSPGAPPTADLVLRQLAYANAAIEAARAHMLKASQLVEALLA